MLYVVVVVRGVETLEKGPDFKPLVLKKMEILRISDRLLFFFFLCCFQKRERIGIFLQLVQDEADVRGILVVDIAHLSGVLGQERLLRRRAPGADRAQQKTSFRFRSLAEESQQNVPRPPRQQWE